MWTSRPAASTDAGAEAGPAVVDGPGARFGTGIAGRTRGAAALAAPMADAEPDVASLEAEGSVHEPMHETEPDTEPDTPDTGHDSGHDTGHDAASGERAAVRRRRRTGLSTPARLAAMGVAAVVLGAAAVGIQAWDRSQWVAARYPAENVQEVMAGQSGTRAGMRWTVRIERAPRSAQDKPGRVMLQITAMVTPVDEKEIEKFLVPEIEFRDRAGRKWMALTAGGTPIRSDMRVGKTETIKAYGVVPEELADSARVALVYSSEDAVEVLLFRR